MYFRELHVFTANFSAQVTFYREVLELDIVTISTERASFRIGSSLLVLQKKDGATPYHIAINIPANKIKEALHWLRSRVAVLPHNEQDIHDFCNWNAKAIYFYDNDANIIEFIARKNLKNETPLPFSSSCLLEISEIGLPVMHIENTYKQLCNMVSVDIYDGNFDIFCAIGNEYGMFICIHKQRKKWYPTSTIAYASNFWVRLEEKEKTYYLEFTDGELKEKHRNGPNSL
ncbi:hypothetical protein BSU00_03190 [Tenacibaculum sp. SG-28]|nr:hypothetical protein BSU00_03190 [Tenacibaculum sp. SG-28]